MSIFKKYSSYYDLLYGSKDYQGEAEYIHQLIQSVAPNAKTILDLGCGTGKHDFCLAELGYQVDGVDFSTSMIEIAEQNLQAQFQKQKENLSFSVGDVRSFQNDKKYDVVVSLFHVMSYQTSNADLQAAFETAKSHLKDGGIFIFDFWYGPGVLTDPPVVRVKRLEDPQIHITRIAEPVLHPNDNCVDVNYNIFIKDKGTGAVEELKETHKMRYLFLAELHLFAQEMECLKQLHWLTLEKPGIDTWNACTIYKKC